MIKERPLEGKVAGGELGFKMESAIQLIDGLDVETMSPQVFKESIKRNPVVVPFTETGLKAFQENAFTVAYAQHMNIQHPPPPPEAGFDGDGLDDDGALPAPPPPLGFRVV